MATPTDVLVRIDAIESELRELFAEVRDIRALVTHASVAPVAEPEVGRSSVISILIVVVLPAPFGPRRPKSSPS